MTAHKYGPWIAHNATPDITCPPDAVGKRGQWQIVRETRVDAEQRPPEALGDLRWDRLGGGDVAAYRILIEPVRGELVLTGDNHRQCGWTFGPAPLFSDTHTLRLPTLDGALIPGKYIGPGGAVIKVEGV